MILSDEALMAQFRAGDTAAFDALLERYQRPLVNHILRIVEDRATAEDVFQETFVRLWEHARSFDPRKASFVTFLYTIATNLCRSELRRRQRHPVDSLDDLEDGAAIVGSNGSHPHQSVERRELQRVVRRAMRQLPEMQRLAILMAEFNQMPYAEIARILGCAGGTVKSLVHRGRERLRALLADYVQANDDSGQRISVAD